MSIVSRKIRGSVFMGLLALLIGSVASDVSAQSSAKYSSIPARFNHRSPSGATTEIVEGGTYFDDGDGGLVPAGSPAAKAIAGPAAQAAPRPTAQAAPRATAQASASYVPRTMVKAAARPSVGSVSRSASRHVATEAEEVSPEPMEESMLGHLTGPATDAVWEDDSCGEFCLEPCCAFPLLPLDNLELSAGVQGFTGPVNRGGTGSFGFNEAINWGAPFPVFDHCLGVQLGARATQSNLSGGEFADSSRTQFFATGGLFRRVDLGLQGGLVFDYLDDSWYRQASLAQLRGEISWVFDCRDDMGFWFTASNRSTTSNSVIRQTVVQGGISTVQVNTVSESWRATDLYAFFYRHALGECRDGEARIFGGFTGQSDGLLGIDARLPLSDTWAVEGGFIYLAPKQGTGLGPDAGHGQESWNLGINLVWTPGRQWSQPDSEYYRPLFPVAHNGVFMMDRNP
ncbi:MAG: hypothetical protein NTY19_33310 [Planctomycetota bacterium]|nr:hypothetical protein [Planctomycetota bacterium]